MKLNVGTSTPSHHLSLSHKVVKLILAAHPNLVIGFIVEGADGKVGKLEVGAIVVGVAVVGARVVGAAVVGARVVGARVVGATVVGASVVGAAVVGAAVTIDVGRLVKNEAIEVASELLIAAKLG